MLTIDKDRLNPFAIVYIGNNNCVFMGECEPTANLHVLVAKHSKEDMRAEQNNLHLGNFELMVKIKSTTASGLKDGRMALPPDKYMLQDVLRTAPIYLEHNCPMLELSLASDTSKMLQGKDYFLCSKTFPDTDITFVLPVS